MDVPALVATGADVGEVRSGDFVTGNLGAIETDADFVAKIYWLPKDPAIAKVEQLRVSVADPNDPSVVLIEQHTPAKAGEYSWIDVVDPLPKSGDPPQVEYFWPSGIRFPGRGRWQLTAEAPGHWGCYIVTV